MKKYLFLLFFFMSFNASAQETAFSSSALASDASFSGTPIVVENALSTPAVGILLHIPKGTHIYGPVTPISDQKTHFTVTAPLGGTTGAPIFPKPHALPYGGKGYTGQQMFWMPISLPKDKDSQTVHFHFSFMACNEFCTPTETTFSVTVPDARNTVVPVDISAAPVHHDLSFTLPIALMFFAFLGGLLLNFMPCVFPILSLKAFSAFKKKDALWYAAGVLCGFFGFALFILFFKSFGKEVGWGFQMQSPAFVFFMTLLFFLMGLIAADLFPAPSFSYHQKKLSGGTGFFTGLLAVLIASPCTAPFMGVAVGAALLYASTADLLFIFMSLGLGFSFPFLLLAFVPFSKKILPKPGSWMHHFKVLMAFLLFGSAIWLVTVFLELTSVSMLLLALASMLFLALAGYCLKEKMRKTLIVSALIFAGFSSFFIPSSYQNEWEPFDPDRIMWAQEKSIPVFVRGTAAWCLTCAVNDRTLDSRRSARLFKENGILLMKADFTKQSPLVKSWLAEFDRSGVPLYVLYGKNGPLVLPTLITYDSLKEAIDGNVYF